MTRKSRAMPIIAAIAVLASFAFLNIDGYQLHLVSPWSGMGEMTGEPPANNWMHGWPVGFVVRSSIYSAAAGRGVTTMTFFGDYGLYSRWPIDEAPVIAFSRRAAACNAICCLMLVVGSYAGTAKLVNYLGYRPKFTIRSIFVCVLACAVILALRDWVFASRYVIQIFAALAVGYGTCVSMIAIPWPLRRNVKCVEAAADGT